MPLSSFVTLTQNTVFIIGPIARFFGTVMDAIYNTFASFGIVSLGWSIIAFTIFTRLLMLPIAFKQQKSMKEMQKIQPQIKKIQDKYKNKKDQESQRKMQVEMNELYQEHGVNPLGGCLPLLVQMPIIFALFQVLRNIPAYIMSIKEIYTGIAESVMSVPNFSEPLLSINEQMAQQAFGRDLAKFDPESVNKVIDMLGKFKTTDWSTFYELFPSITTQVAPAVEKINQINFMFGINLADNPNLMSIGVLLPVLNVGIQMLVMKTTSSQQAQSGQAAQTNKVMTYTMPIMTGYFVSIMPAGLGLYWLVGSIFQLGQQLVINKHLHEEENKKA